MIYLDNGATTLHKPQAVRAAVNRALLSCAQSRPGRVSGGYGGGRGCFPMPESGRHHV